MARVAHVVAPGLPRHVTRRGDRREAVFLGDDDRRACLDPISRTDRGLADFGSRPL